MILSRSMREADYSELVAEGQVIIDIQAVIQMWFEYQHKHRLWEYAIAQKALTTVFGDKKGLTVSDHGCGAGFMSPILYWLGHHVRMYEPWTMGSQEDYMMEQMRRVAEHRASLGGSYEMRHTPLCHMEEKDKEVDAAFCISTLEHIGEYQRAFRDLLSTVKSGGLVFLTTDYGEHEKDDYQYAYLRAGKMFAIQTYYELYEIAKGMGFELLGKTQDWKWREENRIVLDYGFGSFALIKET